ncbi:MAG: tetratricopeptide repeat protein, partial [Cyanobacteriota bacterium]
NSVNFNDNALNIIEQTNTISPEDIETLGNNPNNRISIHKPSGKFITINPHGNDIKILASSTTNKTNSNPEPINPKQYSSYKPKKPPFNTTNGETNDSILSPDNEEIIASIPPDLPPQDNSNTQLTTKTNNISPQIAPDNISPDIPKTLPKLERPEESDNQFLNQNDYDDLMRIAISLESENKLEDSLQKYSQAINVSPERYEAYSAKGDVYLKLKEYDQAIDCFEASLKIKEDQVKTIFNLAITYNKKEEYLKAISNFEKVISLSPENFEAVYNLANIYFAVKDYKRASTYYNQCIALSQKSKNKIELSRIRYNLANTYKALNEPENAIKEYKEAIKLFAEFADAHYNLAATYIDTGKMDKAIEEFKEYIKYTPSEKEKERVQSIIDQLK